MTSSPRTIVDTIARSLKSGEPAKLLVHDSAAVAVIFRLRDADVKLLLIKRAELERDPWSGQVAFPGGRVESGDTSFRETAARETREELGIDLSGNATFLGYLGSFKPRNRAVSVVPSLFVLEKEVSIRPDREVSSFQWVGLQTFLSRNSRSVYTLARDGMKFDLPSFVFNGYVIWGLTERILSDLVGRL